MEPTDRVNFIVEIGRRLSAEDWGIIDLTLRQFGCSTTDNWSGGSMEYVLASLENTDPSVLKSLGRHVGLDVEDNRPVTLPDFWRDGYLRLFLSHLAEHKKFAASLQAILASYGISSFVAHNDIEPSREWTDEIEAALGTCDAALALMHPKFHDSFWVDQELGFVMGRGLPVLTVRLGQNPYGFLGRFQALKTRTENAHDLAEEVFDVLVSHKITSARMTSALISRLEQSESFADAKSNVDKLEKAIYWDTSISDRCLNAIEANAQVGESWGVSERIQSLIKKFAKHA